MLLYGHNVPALGPEPEPQIEGHEFTILAKASLFIITMS